MLWLKRKLSQRAISKYTDSGALPGRYSAHSPGLVSQREILEKKFFALEIPKPSDEYIAQLPDLKDVLSLLIRDEKKPYPKNRVSLLLPFFAQHLTDAVFQSIEGYGTAGYPEIFLNQIYGNKAKDTEILRSHKDGKLKSQYKSFGDKKAEFPPALLESIDGSWVVKSEFQNLSYLEKKENLERILRCSDGKQHTICATGVLQGNLTLGNFAITTLLLREHNRLCDVIKQELIEKNKPHDDTAIFRLARQNSTVAYMKVVIEDYINAYAGIKIFTMDTKSFFYEKKRWCRESPMPYHFNILYRLHSMIPNVLKGHEDRGFMAFIDNNDLVMEEGLGAVLQIASSQAAEQVRLGNTSVFLKEVEAKTLASARGVLASFNAHRESSKKGSSLGFKDLDPDFREELKRLYKDPDKIDYFVGILAELPKAGVMTRVGIRKPAFIGETLMNAIAQHAFRHILSHRFMTREFLNADCMTDAGWASLHNTSTVADMVKRNVPEMKSQEAKDLRISFDAPKEG